jgi:hypothetical protein
VKGVVGAEEGAQAMACLTGLRPAFCGEFYAVVGDGLVDVSVFWRSVSIV